MYRHHLYLLTLSVLLTFPPFMDFALATGGELSFTDVKPLSNCKAFLKNDTLTLENSLISRTYLWNKGDIVSLSLTNKASGKRWSFKTKQPNSYFPGQSKVISADFLVKTITETPISPSYLQVEIITKMDSLSVKKIFRIYESSPAIACDYYFKGRLNYQWNSRMINQGDLKNIETNAVSDQRSPEAVLETVSLTGIHWKIKAVEFTDITDRNNNLVEEVNQLVYRKKSYLKGNLLFAEELIDGEGIFLLKESPSSVAQLSYPGYDFVTELGKIQVVGLGLDAKDINTREWTRGYGYVLGVTNNGDLAKLTALRSYQKNIRVHKPFRDDMILMNTWGDRNQDKSINEKFITAELIEAQKLGITHLQIDDGWQSGRSENSAFSGGSFEKIWTNNDYWKPDPKKFSGGLERVVSYGEKLNIEICLWFNPSKEGNYKDWEKDANALLYLFKTYHIRTFKIDGVQIENKQSEINLRKMFNKVILESENQIVFNLDVTAGKRYGYHYFNEYGSIFLENRYTDWGNYFPHWTLRNLWQLSRYVPAENIQVEFLNNARNPQKYEEGDLLAPSKIDFEYTFAITMMAQPLAWFEATGLSKKAFETATAIKSYQKIQSDIHKGNIFPIGEEPSGTSWTGFQSINGEKGYLLFLRELTLEDTHDVGTYLHKGKRVMLRKLLGDGKDKEVTVGEGGSINVNLPRTHSYVLYQYQIIN